MKYLLVIFTTMFIGHWAAASCNYCLDISYADRGTIKDLIKDGIIDPNILCLNNTKINQAQLHIRDRQKTGASPHPSYEGRNIPRAQTFIYFNDGRGELSAISKSKHGIITARYKSAKKALNYLPKCKRD